MAEGNWSVIRVEKISAEGAQKTERHNERKNESYANLNVDTEQIARNVHFKDTGGLTYNEYFQRLIDEGKISTRGQKAGATIFNELVIDVNTRYFEEHGGYEYAKQFYEEAYRFGCEIYGKENIVSAVMHADEINKAVSEELGKPVYHYHLHIVAIPTVQKEILWSKRCKDEALRRTVKEVINQVSHSKKWKNTVPLLDENGQQVISKYGKPMFRKSYSVLQDKLFAHMTEAGFTGFERGVLGSTAENLSSLDYQIQKDKERLADIQERIEAEQVRYHKSNGTYDTALQLTDFDPVMVSIRHYDFADAAKDTPFYKEIIPAMLDYFETEHYVFTHGWIPSIPNRDKSYSYISSWREADREQWSQARWFNGMDAAQTADENKAIVCGHWHTSYGHSKYEHKGTEFGEDADFSPYYGPGIIAIDACTAFSGKVNCLVIED